MRWQQGLRWGFAVAGVSFAALLYVRFNRTPSGPAAPLPERLPDKASYQATMSPGGKQCRFQDGKEVSCVSFTKFTQYTDGRRVIEQPRFEGDRGGKPFLVTADRGELRAAAPNAEPNEVPDETHLIGHVVMHEQDGMEITTDDATYLESTAVLTVPGPLAFHSDRLSGSGVGAMYARNDQLLRINGQAKVFIKPDETGHGKLDGQSQTMELNRKLHALQLSGGAVIVRDQETIRTDVDSMHLNDDEHGVSVMQLRGHSGIVPLDAKGNTPEMHGDDIDLEFHPDGRTIRRALMKRQAALSLAGAEGRRQITGDTLDAVLAPDGSTVTSLAGTPPAGGVVEVSLPQTADTPRRVIRAKQFNASGNEKTGLTAAVFQQNVEFTEQRAAAGGNAAVDRRATSRQLALALNGGDIGDIKEARFRDGVTFHDGATVGIADDVNYLAADNKLVLRPIGAQGKRSEVDAERINVRARDIDIELEHTKITATGDVRTETKPGKGSNAKGLFDDAKPVSGQAATLHYDDTTSLASYDGSARLWQGVGKDMSRIQADTISVDDNAGDLTAAGNVVTNLPMDNVSSTGEAPKGTATSLKYVDASHRAIYTGSTKALAEFAGPDGVIKAVTIDLTLSEVGRELVTMVGDGTVAARVASDQTARGNHLNYDVKAGQYVLDGKPAKLISKAVENGVETCDATFGDQIVYTKAAKTGDKPDVTIGKAAGSGSQSARQPNCQEWIIK